KENFNIINVYGPTECCDVTTLYPVAPDPLEQQRIPIGKPISNMKAYVLSSSGTLQPIGGAGELVIGGVGLGRGYLNRPQLTQEKYVPNPFEKGKLLYRSGDLVRWLSDGSVQFLGRIDHQVKVRGFRIEPGEIERCLVKHKGIDKAVVMIRKDRQRSSLCAYVVSNGQLTVPGIREFLSVTLPDYMIPSHFVTVETIPLTPSGKVDRGTLESIGTVLDVEIEYVAPRDGIEEDIAKLWKEVLGLDQVGIHENFFDLGGTSLDIIKLNSKLITLLGEGDHVVQMFRYPTISSFADYLNQGRNKEESDSPAVTSKRSLPVSKIKHSRKRQINKRRGKRNA
ncbi:MAG: non-ribosomal peptide synthetase, partial [bacterium]|nr:non-ribosomal peptide synthetase [bacterium]